MRVLYVTPEIAPWMKSGGLGDVSHSLPLALRRLGVDVRLLLPAYPPIKHAFPEARPALALPYGAFASATLLEATSPEGLPLLLLDCPACYAREGSAYQDDKGRDWPDNHLRFGLLCRVAAHLGSQDSPLAWRPQIIHCHDWPSGLVPAYLRYGGSSAAATVFTVHNMAFQGNFPPATLRELGLPATAFTLEGVEFYGQVSFLKAALQLADRITTVSPTYAAEIQTREFGCGMDGLLRYRRERLTGILNGIDVDLWNPATDPLIARNYDYHTIESKAENKRQLQARMGLRQDDSLPLLGCVARITHQKGLDLLLEIGEALAAMPVQLALLGKGDAALEAGLTAMCRAHPQSFGLVLGYDEALAHLIEAGADAFLMPSRFEPCGLNQMYSQRYGTPPIVRTTGGLADTVTDYGTGSDDATGFVFREASGAALLQAIRRACAAWRQSTVWRRLQANGMHQDFSWNHAASLYQSVYASAL